MKKRRAYELFSMLILMIMLVYSAILPVCAEETEVFDSERIEEIPEAEETAETAEVLEPVEAGANAADAEVPRVTVSSVEWKGGDLIVPVSLGDYDTDDLMVDIWHDGLFWTRVFHDNRELITKDYIAVPILQGEANTSARLNLAKSGNCSVTMVFSDGTNVPEREINRSEFTIEVKKDSKPWRLIDETVPFDGSQDVTFHFENGTNYFEIESLESIVVMDEIFSDGGGWSGVELKSIFNDFSFDMSADTITIEKNALKRALAICLQADKSKDKFCVGVVSGVIGSGRTRIDYWDEDDACVWWLDVSSLDLDSVSAWWESPFTDVAVDNWYYDAAGFVYERGIMTGMTETEFGPSVKLSRAQFATILYRMEGEPEVAYNPAAFPDVREGQFYTAPAMWAKSTGVISGYEDGRFGPADEITREQMAVMMYRYANILRLDTSAEGDMSGFPDAGRVSPFAEREVNWAVGAGLIKGDGGNVNPQGTAERAQCATIIMRFMEGYGL